MPYYAFPFTHMVHPIHFLSLTHSLTASVKLASEQKIEIGTPSKIQLLQQKFTHHARFQSLKIHSLPCTPS
jgi:hypothetical protein